MEIFDEIHPQPYQRLLEAPHHSFLVSRYRQSPVDLPCHFNILDTKSLSQKGINIMVKHIIFGTGPLGISVMEALIERGESVRMVNRSGKADVPASVEIVKGDAYNPQETCELCKGATVVYQCAQPPYHEWVEKFPPLQSSILEGAAANNAKLVIGDNLYMYGYVQGKIHEELPYSAHTRKGKTRAQMAKVALQAHQDGKVRVTIGRGSDFFGEGVLGSMMGERVFPNLLQGKSASLVGNIDLPHTYTYIKDFGKALAILGERDEALGQVWHVPNAETLTTREFVTIAFELAGLPPKMSGMGKFMMRIGGLFIPEARETVEMMYEFEKPFIVDDSKFKKVFGDISTPIRESLQKTLVWYRQHPHQ
jgi:nucleoside-diphosphate-sugar epimerase